MLEHKYSDFGIRCSMAYISGRHLYLHRNEIIISLRYYMKVLHEMILICLYFYNSVSSV